LDRGRRRANQRPAGHRRTPTGRPATAAGPRDPRARTDRDHSDQRKRPRCGSNWRPVRVAEATLIGHYCDKRSCRCGAVSARPIRLLTGTRSPPGPRGAHDGAATERAKSMEPRCAGDPV